jgi:predicted nucleic acid-binding protein
LQAWLGRIPADYGDRLLAIDAETAGRYALLMAAAEQDTRALTAADCWDAALALRHGMTLIARHTPALKATGVRIWNADTGELTER